MTSMKQLLLAVVITSLVFTSACSSNQDNAANRQNNNNNRMQTQMNENDSSTPLRGTRPFSRSQTDQSWMNQLSTEQNASIPYQFIQGVPYVSLNQFLQITELNATFDEQQQQFEIGDNDIAYQISMNEARGMVDEQQVQLSGKPMLIKDEPYVPLDTLQKIFSDQVTMIPQTNEVLIQASADELMQIDEGNADTEEDTFFMEDPNDPAKDESVFVPLQGAVPALKDININHLIQHGRQYLGVKYDFGAKPYPRSKRFDCSSFVQYLFEKKGVDMLRTARAQARQGVYVSRTNLRRGDLLFFYVPGRFKTNKTVGHVGIYIGNNKMLHSSPQPKNGVQITNINKKYWKKTYLRAKRVAF